MMPENTENVSRDTSQDLSDNGGRKRSTPRAAAVIDRELHMALSREAPLPYDDDAPPLPDEAPPEDDGWIHHWDENARAWYFYNRLTGKSQWENPRVPETASTSYGSYDRYVSSATGPATSTGAPGTSAPGTSSPPKPKPKRLHGGYNPAIHGNYDPNASYAQEAEEEEEEEATAAAASLTNPQGNGYATTAHFNRWTGRFQQPGINPEYHNDENKSKRQMNAFFDVDAAANSHDGRSLRAERRGKTLTKKELKAYKEKRHHKKEEKRKAWLRD